MANEFAYIQNPGGKVHQVSREEADRLSKIAGFTIVDGPGPDRAQPPVPAEDDPNSSDDQPPQPEPTTEPQAPETVSDESVSDEQPSAPESVSDEGGSDSLDFLKPKRKRKSKK